MFFEVLVCDTLCAKPKSYNFLSKFYKLAIKIVYIFALK